MVYMVIGAAAVSAAVVVLFWAISGEREAALVSRNLMAGRPAATDLRTAVLAHAARDRAIAPFMARLAAAGRRFTPTGMLDGIERRVLLAGVPEAWTLERVLAVKVGLGGTGTLLGLFGLVVAPSFGRLGLMAAMAAAGWFSSDVVLRHLADERQARIREQLPDTLDQITVCVEAGLGFEAALSRVGRTGTGPLAQELLRTLQDMQVGMSRREALRALVQRTDADDLRSFVSAVVQAESYGVPIANALRVQAAELRVKRRQRAEERAMKLPVKLVFPVVLCIFPALFVVLIGPAVIRIARALSGGIGV